MQQHDVSEKTTKDQEPPLWVPPPPPASGPGAWVRTLIERFGFVLASAVTLLALVLLFLNSEWLLREPGSSAASEPAAGEAPPAVLPAEPLDATFPLSIATVPEGARVFINDEPVGETPLQEYALPAGTYRISLRKENYVALDTSVALASAPLALALSLSPAEAEGAGEAAQEEAAVSSAEPRAETPPRASATAERSPPGPEPSSSRPDAPRDQPAPAAPTVAVDVPPVEAAEEAPAFGDVRATSQPSGATVMLGVDPLGNTPLVVRDVPAGTYRLSVRLDGYQVYETTLEVAAGRMNAVNAQLRQVEGTLAILARPWGAIYIDGELHKRESSVWYTVQLPVGTHRVRVEHPSLGKWENSVTVSEEEAARIVVDFNKGQQQ